MNDMTPKEMVWFLNEKAKEAKDTVDFDKFLQCSMFIHVAYSEMCKASLKIKTKDWSKT